MFQDASVLRERKHYVDRARREHRERRSRSPGELLENYLQNSRPDDRGLRNCGKCFDTNGPVHSDLSGNRVLVFARTRIGARRRSGLLDPDPFVSQLKAEYRALQTISSLSPVTIIR